MWPIVTNGVAWSLCLSVGLSVMTVSTVKTAELIEMPFGMWTRVGPRKHVLDGGAHCIYLAYTIGPSACGNDATFL